MSLKKRLEKMENQIRPEREPEFHAWQGNEWTEEEKAAALGKHPDCTFFWKTLSSTLPLEELQRGQANGAPPENRGMRYIAGPAEPSTEHNFPLSGLQGKGKGGTH